MATAALPDTGTIDRLFLRAAVGSTDDAEKVYAALMREEFVSVGDLRAASDSTWATLATRLSTSPTAVAALRSFVRGTAPRVVASAAGLHHEPQEAPDTCFRHAMAMYHQAPHMVDRRLLDLLRTLVSAAGDAAIAAARDQASFYGPTTPSSGGPAGLCESSSDPLLDEDLRGYMDVYQAMPASCFVDEFERNGLKELAPQQVLFLLEFQAVSFVGHSALVYVPHRFYHRYAWSSDATDVAASRLRFADALDSAAAALPGRAAAFFCRVQASNSHAFAARHTIADGFVLLDSLMSGAVPTGHRGISLMADDALAGRASVMILPDVSRPSKVIAVV
jgi:hypothetical protein